MKLIRHIYHLSFAVLLAAMLPFMAFERTISIDQCSCEAEFQHTCCTNSEMASGQDDLPPCCQPEKKDHSNHGCEGNCCSITVHVPGLQLEYLANPSQPSPDPYVMVGFGMDDQASLEENAISFIQPSAHAPPHPPGGIELLISLHQLRIALS